MSDNVDSQDRTISIESDSKPTRLLRPGDVVGGHYELKSVIGRGGMGLVFLAEHRGLHKQYALKALAPERSSEANWQRFKNEGIAIGRLDHPNIVKVYDMGVDGSDCLYYVMDLLDGVPLSDVIRRKGALDVKETLAIFSQLCAGLGYAHKRGLVHRDIKPNNIIMCKAGPGQPRIQAKIIDFGLVKLVGQDSYLVQAQTRAGTVCGSPYYMSPEQCRGGRIDERSDIYSLGCTLFECLTGEPPFVGKTGLDTAYMHENNRVPSLSQACPERKYPQNLEQVVSRLLEKVPGKRYQTAEQVAQDLERVKHGQAVNREAVYTKNATVEINIADIDHSGQEKDKRTLLIVSLLGVLLVGATIWGGIAYFCAKPNASVKGAMMTGASLTEEQANVREMFTNWPQISSGVVVKNNAACRLFNFPSVPVGELYWGCESGQREVARGEVQAPPDKRLTLSLQRPTGLYTRMFPVILTKFRPDDIWALEVKDPQNQLAETVIASDVTPELIDSVSGWTALQKLEFYHCNLKPDAVAAMDKLQNINELRLRTVTYDPAALANLKWLKQIEIIDLKNCSDVDAVISGLEGSPHLKELIMDCTAPSVGSFKALQKCPNLKFISLSDTDLTGPMIEAISKISSLNEINLENNDIKPEYFPMLAPLKNLRKITVPHFEGQEYRSLRSNLPQTMIKMDRKPAFRM